MKFAIVGSGALGCRYGYQLHQAEQEVILIDQWPAHIEAIREKGLKVDFNGEIQHVNIPIYYPHEVTEEIDVVILLTKAMQLDQMLQAIQSSLRPHTKVICLLNGLGHESVIEKYVSLDNMIMGTTIWTAALVGPGEVKLHGGGTMAIQSLIETEANVKLAKEVVEVLNQANLSASYSEDVKHAIWQKACVNGVSNATTTLLECNLGQFINHEQTPEIVKNVVSEFAFAASTQGVTLDVDRVTDYIITATKKVGEHYPSMYQDLVKNHRKTEIDYINGAVARIAKAHGKSAPICEFITQMIHIKESVLDAK